MRTHRRALNEVMLVPRSSSTPQNSDGSERLAKSGKELQAELRRISPAGTVTMSLLCKTPSHGSLKSLARTKAFFDEQVRRNRLVQCHGKGEDGEDQGPRPKAVGARLPVEVRTSHRGCREGVVVI